MDDEHKLINGAGAVLDHDALLALCEATPPLIEPFDPAMLQPNGLELSLESVWRMARYGSLPAPGTGERTFPDYYAIKPDREGWWHLEKGCYKVIYSEYVRIPAHLCAMARPRSSLLRMGAWIATALWDSGYQGRSESLLMVENPAGISIQRGARLIQLIFFTLGRDAGKLYDGRYQGENR
jgi:dUTP pyrophosphatase